MRFLRKRIEDLQVVDYAPSQEGKVFFGAWVKLVDDDNESLTFRIVGTDEIYGRKNYVSIDAPIARASLRKEEGEEVFVKTEVAEKVWYIDKIWYVDKPDSAK